MINEKLFRPESIVIVGASNNIHKPGGKIVKNLLDNNFQGELFTVNPKEDNIQGIRSYHSTMELPSVDLAILAIPAQFCLNEVTILAEQKNTKAFIIISAGFGETSEEGKVWEQKISKVISDNDGCLIGPNCIGVVNTECDNNILNCTWFPFELPEGEEGNISLASQSGSWISQTLIWAERRGLRIRKAISTGNEANVSISECFDNFLQDKGTKVVATYIEGIKKDAKGFIESLRALAKEKPVIVSYHGGTTAGARAGLSHTASLGGKPSIYEAIFKQAGVIRASNMEEMFEFSHAFSLAHPPKGKRIGLITNSGGPAVTLADLCERSGLVVPSFSDELQEKLKNR